MSFIELKTTTQFRINYDVIANWTLNPQGMVSKFTRRVADNVRDEAASLTSKYANSARNYAASHGAPPRSGRRLKDSYAVSLRRLSPTNVEWRVSNDRPYALAVFKGHRGPTFPAIIGLSNTSWQQLEVKGGQSRTPPLYLKLPGGSPVRGYSGRNYPLEALVKVMGQPFSQL